MLVIPDPARARQELIPGRVFFSYSHGSLLSSGIGRESAREAWEKGLLVPSHTGIVLEDGLCAEAWWPRWRIASLRERLESRDTLIWVRTPVGQTPASAAEICRLARLLEGRGYDTSGVLAFTLSEQDDCGRNANWWEDPEEYFCSEGADVLLRQTEDLRTVPLPPAYLAVHPSWRTPAGLDRAPIWQ